MTEIPQTTAVPPLFRSDLSVISAGVGGFAEALRRQSVPVVDLDWRPPAEGQLELVEILKAIYADPELPGRIAAANRETLRRIVESNPQIVDVAPAGAAMGLPDRTVLHAGPPIAWERMCGPQRRAVQGAIRFEGWAAGDAEAAALVETGQVRLLPNHVYNAVGPMTGIISPSMPVLVARNETFGSYGFSTLNEGRGNTLWFGVCDERTLDRLRWMRDRLAPALRAAIRRQGPLNVFDIVAQALQMGDECHARSQAATALLVRRLAPAMLDAGVAPSIAAEVLRYADANSHCFLNFTMAAVKATMDAAHGVPYSTLATAIARNGVELMLRVGGLGGQWATSAVAPMDQAVYYTGYSVGDAAGDIGDSAIIETCGLGGMAIAAAPTVAPFVGGRLADEIALVERLATVAAGRHTRFSLPTMDMQNPPLGLDVLRVVETRIVPFITTGVVHEHSPTAGQIGTGVARIPAVAFDRALVALAQEWGLPVAPAQPAPTVSIEPAPVPEQ
ncbi:MAG TPA: DUF1116 domain-containing protein [Roseiflexaceae bacterium]